VRSQQPAQPPPPLLVLVARDGPTGRTQTLIDTSPDLREQLIGADVARLDAVLITHEHADHTHGIDDLRPIYMAMRRRLDIHVDAATSEALRRKFGYIFATPPGSSYPPMAQERRIHDGEPIVVEGRAGRSRRSPSISSTAKFTRSASVSAGLPIRPPQCRAGNEPALARGARRLGRRRLAYAPHPSHWSVGDALAAIEQLRPRRAC